MIENGEEYDSEQFDAEQVSDGDWTEVRFYNCRFSGVDLSQRTIRGCQFVDCTFERCNLSVARVVDSRFSAVQFNNCNLMGINWSEASWPSVRAGGMLAFTECNLSYCTFIGLSLKAMKLQRCQARNADFRDGDFARSDFSHSDLKETLFAGSDLSGCDFRHALHYEIDLRSNKTAKARFSLPEALSLLYSSGIVIGDEDDH